MDASSDIEPSLLALARANAILGVLSEATLVTLLAHGQPVDVAAGEALVRQSETSECAYLIVDGEFEVQVATAYGEVMLARVGPGVLIGEIGVFADLPRNATVRAISGARALRFDRTPLREAGDRDPALLRSVIGRLGGQISRFNSAMGLYTNAVAALERNTFDVGILDELRQPSPELVDFAQHFRRMAEQIVLRRAHEAEMASAAAIQRAMLPAGEPAKLAGAPFDIHPHMTPAREVGGDLYDLTDLGGTRIGITIGDVCGKGVPAALFMAVTQTVMRLVVRSGEDLKREIETANDLLVANNREDMFATLFCGVLDTAAGTLTYCNCGHNPPLLLRHGAETFEALTACGPPLGVMDGMSYKTRAVTFEPGDMLFLYADGVTEAEKRDATQFGSQRLEQVLLSARGAPSAEVVERVLADVTAFADGADQSDDITCIAVRRTES